MTNPEDDSTSNTTSGNNQQVTTTTTTGTSPSNWVAGEPDGMITEGAHLGDLEKRNK